MDRALPAHIVKARKIKRIIIIAGVIAFLVIVVLGLQAFLTPTIDRDRMLTSVVERGPIEATVSASGTVVPASEQVVTSSIESRIDTVLLKAGDAVVKGQSILRLNMEAIGMTYNRLQDELELLSNEKAQLNLKLQQNRIDFQAQHDIKELQVQYAESQVQRDNYLSSIGGMSKEEAERSELNLAIARRELDQLTSQIANQENILEADLRELDLKIRIQDNNIGEVRRQMDLAEARADRDGVVTWIQDDIGSAVKPGDVIARVADLGSFKVEAKISDIHAGKLKVGGAVRVRIKNHTLTGHVAAIEPTIENGIMTFIVELDDSSDNALRSNLRVDVFVVTSFKDNVLRVKNGPFYNGSIDQKIYIVEDDHAIRKIVTIGESNYDFVEIIGDVSPGDEVIISDMKDYYHMEKVAINDK